MAKNNYYKEEQEEVKEIKEVKVQEMSVAEARKIRAAAYKAAKTVLTEQEKREAFRIFWAQEKSKYSKSKDLEEVIWLHLKAMKMDLPEKFQDGIKHFGLSKVR